MFVLWYIFSVGEMSSTVSERTRRPWSRARRWPTRPPRSWPTTWKRDVAERLHHLDHVERHRALRVVRVVGQPLRLRRVAVAAQVGADHACSRAPAAARPCASMRVRLRIAVQQQHRRPFAAELEVDRRAAGLDAALLEAGKEALLGHAACSASVPERPGHLARARPRCAAGGRRRATRRATSG